MSHDRKVGLRKLVRKVGSFFAYTKRNANKGLGYKSFVNEDDQRLVKWLVLCSGVS